ncbi:MAG: trypsin-like peptidase domain-containing protein [Candidatus Nanopelagicales bacterium]
MSSVVNDEHTPTPDEQAWQASAEQASQGQPAGETAQPPAAEQPATFDPNWPIPDHRTQVIDPDAAQTTAYPQYGYGQQAGYEQPHQAGYEQPQYGQPEQPQYPSTGSDGYLPPPPGVTPQAPSSAEPKKSGGVGKVIAIAALTGLLAGGVGGAVGYSVADSSNPASSVSTGSNPTDAENLSVRAEGSIAAIADKVLPSVVSIEVSDGSGSGFILSQDGYILTNNHVIESAANGGQIEVVMQDGTRVQADLVGRNADYDLAVLKIDKSGLTPVTVGNSESVKVGDQAIAIGSPLGLEGTVTSGIVSSLNRPVTAGGGSGSETSFINAIQTDAPINPGNSGGPLVNGEGQVIGVNSAIASLSSGTSGQAGSIGLGFAIPINTANRIAQEIIKTGTSQTPIIGAEIDFNYTGQGARVNTVTSGGPAEKAGLKSGDIIVAVNGQRVDDAVSLITDIRQNAPGDEITLTLEGGKEITVTLGSR